MINSAQVYIVNSRQQGAGVEASDRGFRVELANRDRLSLQRRGEGSGGSGTNVGSKFVEPADGSGCERASWSVTRRCIWQREPAERARISW